MKSEDLYEAMESIDDVTLEGSERSKAGKQSSGRMTEAGQRGTGRIYVWWGAAAAVVVLVLCGVLFGRNPVSETKAYAIAEAEYPKMAPDPQTKTYLTEKAQSEAWSEWRNGKAALRQTPGYEAGLESYLEKSMQEFLSGADGQNVTFSPVNIYMALGMLAELTEGNSQKQILELLGQENLEGLRKQAQAVWKANYCDDGSSSCILAASLWLNEDVAYRKDALERVKENYFASSYRGQVSDPGYSRAFQDWLNDQTGGLLSEQIQEGGGFTDPEMVMTLATTLYFRARWTQEFSKNGTEARIFHAPGGDAERDFMRGGLQSYYWGEHFGASVKWMMNGAQMWFVLPDEGVSLDELLEEDAGQLLQMFGSVCGKNAYENNKNMRVNLFLPKFDVVSQINLKEELQSLGITEVFEQGGADFEPLMYGAKEAGVCITKAQHDVRVCIDEEGVKAAAITRMDVSGAGMPPEDEMDFVLDRPFLFAIVGDQGVPLFVGVVNQP